MSTGYSGTPLATKLGIKPDLVVAFAAEGVTAPLPDRADVLLFTVRTRAHLEQALPGLLARMSPAGSLWLSWPKRGSGIETDLDENVLRALVLPTGWVDNKVAAIDGRWSGLRFVLRRELRPAR